MGRSNRYLGAFNRSTVKGLERQAFGTWFAPKPTVLQRKGMGAKVLQPEELRRAKQIREIYSGKERKLFRNGRLI